MDSNLETLHREAGAEITQSEGRSVVRNYGDIQSEHASARKGCGLFDLSFWDVVRLEGPDRASFLHGMVTNEVKNLQPGQGAYNLILTPKGKIISDLWLLARENDLVLLTRGCQGQTIAQTLNKFLIMENAAIIEDSSHWGMVALQGPSSKEILRRLVKDEFPEEEHAWTPVRAAGKDFIAFRASFTGEDGFLLLGKLQSLPALWRGLTELGAKPAGQDALEVLRIEAGIPICGRELKGDIIPQEACLHHALSFTKGCYIGQETVARLHFRGHVNRELTGFFLERSEPTQGEVRLFETGKQIGSITSACYSYSRQAMIGLGYLRISLKEAGRELEAHYGEERFTVRVAELPFAGA